MEKLRQAIASRRQLPAPASPLSTVSSSPGVLILSFSLEMLYVTPRARKLLAQLDGVDRNSSVRTSMSPALQHLCDEFQACLQRNPSASEWDQLHVQHLAQTGEGTILLRGYGIPKEGKTKQGRLLILLEAIASESSVSNCHAELDYRLTDRQRGIVDGLMRGLSNKELAVELGISTHTVKEYIRQIMMKLKTTSRTGIVARVAGLTHSVQPGLGTHRLGNSSHTVSVA